MPDIHSSIDSLRRSLAATRTASTLPPCDPDDQLQAVLQPFVAEAEPQVEKLDALYVDLQRELTGLTGYFGEKEGSVETLFSTVLAFGHSLQKAAAEMTKVALRDGQSTSTVISTSSKRAEDEMLKSTSTTLDAMSQRLDRHEAMASAVTVKMPSKPAKTSLVPPPAIEAGRKTMRGTISRGELDEAIRSIHGGVKRRERREASMAGGTFRLSKMFLDGGRGSVRQSSNTRPVEGIPGI